MRRVLKLVMVPFAVGLLVAFGLAWWLTPRPRELSVSTNSRILLEMSGDGTLALLREQPEGSSPSYILCDTRSASEIARFNPPECQGARLTSDGRLVTWTGGGESELVVQSYDPRDLTTKDLLRRPVRKILLLECAADARTLAWMTGEEPAQIEVWDIPSGARRAAIPFSSSPQLGWKVFSLADDGTLVAALDGFTRDISTEPPPMSVILHDATTGAQCDRLILPKGIAGFPSFERGAKVLRLMEDRISHFITDPVTGRPIPQMMFLSNDKFYDFTATHRFDSQRAALGRDPQGAIWVVPGPDRESAQIHDDAGEALSQPLRLSMHDSWSGPRIVQGTTFLVTNESRQRAYPQWAQVIGRRIGLSFLLRGPMHEQAVLVDWKTGQGKILRSKPDFHCPGRSRLAGYSVAVSPNASVLSLTYETEGGCHTEFWDVARLRRPWWLITLSAVLAVVVTVVLLLRLEKRRTQFAQRALITPEAT